MKIQFRLERIFEKKNRKKLQTSSKQRGGKKEGDLLETKEAAKKRKGGGGVQYSHALEPFLKQRGSKKGAKRGRVLTCAPDSAGPGRSPPGWCGSCCRAGAWGINNKYVKKINNQINIRGNQKPKNCISSEKATCNCFQIESNMIVETVFRLIVNRTEIRLIVNQTEVRLVHAVKQILTANWAVK